MIQNVLLTGANGFLASHILSQLLTSHTFSIQHVRAVVRTSTSADRILHDFPSNSRLSIAIVPDYAASGAFDSAVVSTDHPFDVLIHTPSGFGDLASSAHEHPMVKGALELLGAVKRFAPTVQRVVLTSSNAAVIDYDSKIVTTGKVFDEEDWNPVSWEEAVAAGVSGQYKASKKFMEIAAMDFISKHQPSFGLVVLCPAAVFGPLTHVAGRSINDLNLSNGMFWKIFCCAGKEAKLPKQTVWSYVDVRDLATAHILATTCSIPSAFDQCLRLIISARQFTYKVFCDTLRANVPALAERTPQLPESHVADDGAYGLSNARAVEVFGEDLVFRPMEETVVELAEQLLEVDRSEKRSGKW
ncbi:MAG: methylglyoxal reductase (NADPH-dependent) gre2 [Alectoria sarmentosa]|nr:MAG: methylglyoxal reductase (NADPH-dependent) gre2 [Alectoria sarmentosa]